jgi:hypothetical protein
LWSPFKSVEEDYGYVFSCTLFLEYHFHFVLSESYDMLNLILGIMTCYSHKTSFSMSLTPSQFWFDTTAYLTVSSHQHEHSVGIACNCLMMVCHHVYSMPCCIVYNCSTPLPFTFVYGFAWVTSSVFSGNEARLTTG